MSKKQYIDSSGEDETVIVIRHRPQQPQPIQPQPSSNSDSAMGMLLFFGLLGALGLAVIAGD